MSNSDQCQIKPSDRNAGNMLLASLDGGVPWNREQTTLSCGPATVKRTDLNERETESDPGHFFFFLNLWVLVSQLA